MSKENVSLNLVLKKIDETRNQLLEEIKHNDLISEKHKKVCKDLNYFDHFLVFISAVIDSVSISPFASLVNVSISILSSSVRLIICAISAGAKKHNSFIAKRFAFQREKHDKIVFLAKIELDAIKFLIFKGLTESYSNHDEFALVNNALKEYNYIKEEFKDSKKSVEYNI